ncbi:hypothetical protein P5673_016614 [Acropora cervicornis]|uniref:Uncharacterized protein n=1 Tax=Acropora cervicornis TaxID=6130 RepID=A0AAD9QH15_ACRCE|nr:hypothetical protein P5673_016614 [Acropora cervicornis]
MTMSLHTSHLYEQPSLEATLLLRRVGQHVLWHNELALLEEPLEPKEKELERKNQDALMILIASSENPFVERDCRIMSNLPGFTDKALANSEVIVRDGAALVKMIKPSVEDKTFAEYTSNRFAP